MPTGPEPRMRMLASSSLRAMSGGLADVVEKEFEEVESVVRPGARLGVVLDGAAGHVQEREALDRAVVEVDVAELRGAEVGLPAHRLVGRDPALAARAQAGEAVVLGRDLDPAGPQVLDGM